MSPGTESNVGYEVFLVLLLLWSTEYQQQGRPGFYRNPELAGGAACV
jgi:hypothetical protein